MSADFETRLREELRRRLDPLIGNRVVNEATFREIRRIACEAVDASLPEDVRIAPTAAYWRAQGFKLPEWLRPHDPVAMDLAVDRGDLSDGIHINYKFVAYPGKAWERSLAVERAEE